MEFDLIRQYAAQRFGPLAQRSAQLEVGIGDDCAVLCWPANHRLLVSTDVLVSGRHFFPDTNPFDIGHKALAVNLSDLAAMGAQPVGFTLGLALGQVDHDWLDGFSEGLLSVAQAFACPLVGGDTTASLKPNQLTISITIFGQTGPQLKPTLRSGAQVGDDLWVSGIPGLARLGFLQASHQRDRLNEFLEASEHPQFKALWAKLSAQQQARCDQALARPMPKVELGQHLAAHVNSLIDLSDGLFGDLSHILQQSAVGAILDAVAFDDMWALFGISDTTDLPLLRNTSLIGGDDYELCFTAPADNRGAIGQLSHQLGEPLHRVGVIAEQAGLHWQTTEGLKPIALRSFQHFGRGHS